MIPMPQKDPPPAPPPQPGEVLERLLSALPRATQDHHAERLGMSRRRLNEILRGRRRITASSALRLARYLGNTPEFWLERQMRWELHTVNRRTMREVNAIIPAGRERTRGMLSLLRTEPEPQALAEAEPPSAAELRRLRRQTERDQAIREFLEKNGGKEVQQLLRRAIRHADFQAQLRAEGPEELPEGPIRFRLQEADFLAGGEDGE